MTREVYVKLLNRSNDLSTFEVQFHDGYQKTYKIYRQECRAAMMSERDVLENLIIDYYLDTEKINVHINFIFY